MRAPVIVTLVALAACAPDPAVIEQELSPGDLVIVVSRAEDQRQRRVLSQVVGPSRTVSLTHADGLATALAVIPADAVIDETGATRAWDEVVVDLDGDRGECGCTAPALTSPQVVRPGDRCGLPRSVPILLSRGPTPSELEAELRGQLRITWPGTCACPRAPLVTPSRLEVCPLGVDAQRMVPDRLLVTEDDTQIAIGRGVITHHFADGTSREQPIAPAMVTFTAATALPGGDALILSQRYSRLARSPDLRFVPRTGSSPPIPLELELEEESNGLTIDGLSWDGDQSVLWALGRVGNDLARRPMLARCTLDPNGYRLICDDQRIAVDNDCPQHRGREGLVEMVHLGGGDRLGLTGDGEPIVFDGARQQVVCVPGAEPLRLAASPDAELLVQRVAVLGRRVVACALSVITPPSRAVVFTATVGALTPGALPSIRWTELASGVDGAVYCHETFQDPARPGRIFQPISGGGEYRIVEVTETATAVRTYRAASELFGGVEGLQLEIVSGGGHLAARTPRGELLDLDGGRATSRSTLAASGAAIDRTVRTIVPRAGGGFLVDLGGPQPLVVEPGAREGCDGARVVVPPAALELTDTEADAAAWLGTLALRARHDRTGAALEVRDDHQVLRTLPLEARAVRVVELIAGRWALLLDARGLLWVTDGERLDRLAHDAPLVGLDAAGGVGWAIGNDSLARIQVGRDGRPQLEESRLMSAGVLVDGPPVTPTAIHARCGGRALIATRDFPFPGDGAVDVWWVEPTADGLAVRPYEAFDAKGSARPVGGESVNGISGGDRAPVLLFSGDPTSTAVHAPGAPLAAVPFPHFSAVAYADGDLLVGGPHARLALVRVR